MGLSKSKRAKEPDKFFERVKWDEQKKEEKIKRNMNPAKKRVAAKEPALLPSAMLAHQEGTALSPPVQPPSNIRSFDDETLNLMRYQLKNDSDAFLLNNILLSIQFFENYEWEVQNIQSNPISEHELMINEAMIRHNKHVFFADRLQECVNEHISYQKIRGQSEALTTPRLFVIYDNVEASEPGDTSDYSAVLDAPFYKLRIEDCKEPGYIKMKKLEVLESTLVKENESRHMTKTLSEESIYSESEKGSIDSDEETFSKGEALLNNIKSRLEGVAPVKSKRSINVTANPRETNVRRASGPIKQISLQSSKSNISKLKDLRKYNMALPEEGDLKEYMHDKNDDKIDTEENYRSRKSILKVSRRLSGPIKDTNSKQQVDIRLPIADTIAEDSETSGYRTNSSGNQNELSESDSDYGYCTITQSTMPRKVELTSQSGSALSYGVLPDEIWTTVQARSIDWSDDDDFDDTSSRVSISRNLYDTHYYLCSIRFMRNFIDNFIVHLGSVLDISQENVSNALTQGASVYCDTVRNEIKVGKEVYPALIASWPNAANQWIIRERKIIQNPRTNFSYQWPTEFMVNKCVGFGCLLVPIGFRPKRGLNADQNLQWKIIFPAAERYLESCLAHAHIRCYLFALLLQRSFMDNETSKIGIDATHLKNHLFWQCEDNYAKWPEHRLGESLRLFLRSFYIHFGQGRFPNYFIENCNDFKSIPKPLLLKLQKRLATILESPVMHILSALTHIKYTKKDFYPTFNVYRLYDILTSKTPLRIINPNLPAPSSYDTDESSESDNDDKNFWDKVKKSDKQYQWKKEKQRQMQERRKALFYNRKKSIGENREINTNIILPSKMDVDRRRLVLEFFIPHFIAMARSSEKFDSIRQALIYLEQAQRLCMLLLDEPAGEATANEYLDIIRDKLVDCQKKLVSHVIHKLPSRNESNAERSTPVPKLRPRFEHSQNSPAEPSGFSAFTFVEVHAESASDNDVIKLNNIVRETEDSKL